jgi:hypothetical protein
LCPTDLCQARLIGIEGGWVVTIRCRESQQLDATCGYRPARPPFLCHPGESIASTLKELPNLQKSATLREGALLNTYLAILQLTFFYVLTEKALGVLEACSGKLNAHMEE